MLAVKRTGRFDKSLKLAVRRGRNISKIEVLIEMLQLQQPLPTRCKDHLLIGNYNGLRELKIEPDWLLLYYIENDVLYLFDTGTHSDLF